MCGFSEWEGGGPRGEEMGVEGVEGTEIEVLLRLGEGA